MAESEMKPKVVQLRSVHRAAEAATGEKFSLECINATLVVMVTRCESLKDFEELYDLACLVVADSDPNAGYDLDEWTAACEYLKSLHEESLRDQDG